MSEALTIDQFAQRLEQAEHAPDDIENAQPEEEAQSDEVQEEQQTEVEQEETTDEAEAESDQPEPESLDERVVSWETASGEKFEVPVAELKSGYMRDQDYRHKTQQVAQEREQAHQQIQEQFQTVNAYARDFGALYALDAEIASLEQLIPTLNRDDDPVTYFDVKDRFRELKDQRNGVATRLEQVNQQRSAEMQKTLVEGRQKMLQDLSSLPGFGTELLNKLEVTGRDYGFSDQELATLTDPRIVRLFNDARQFRDLQAKKPTAVNKVKSAPPKPTKQASTAVDSDITKQVKQFSKKKDINSFAALLAKTL
jgi:hypothetical protein